MADLESKRHYIRLNGDATLVFPRSEMVIVKVPDLRIAHASLATDIHRAMPKFQASLGVQLSPKVEKKAKQTAIKAVAKGGR